MATTKLSKEKIEQLRQPAGWCKGVVLDPKKAQFYPEQRYDMNLPENVLIYCKRKSRRCGWSHGLTRRAVALAHIHPDMSIYFVSMNLADAYKKIEECERFYYDVHPDARLPIESNNRTMLRFAHGHACFSEIVATFKPRGMPGRHLQIVVDEADHIPDLKSTLQAAIPNIVQGRSQLLVGGSVYRASGPFWDLFNLDVGSMLDPEAAKLLRPSFERRELFWWQVPWLVDRAQIRERDKIMLEAPAMETRERVMRFGSDRLKLTFATMPLEDFKQEFELCPIAEGASLVPWEVILRCSDDPEHEFCSTIGEMQARAHANGHALYAGYDVGYRSNNAELTIFGQNNSGIAVELYADAFARVELPDQTANLRALLAKVPGLVLAIDGTGPGAEMAQTLKREFPARVVIVEMEYYSKLGLLDAFVNRMMQGRVKFVADEERRRQIFSLKRKVNESGRVIYYVHKSEKHHADKAISQALAVHAIDQKAVCAPFEIYCGSLTEDAGHPELNELAGSHEDFVREVVNA